MPKNRFHFKISVIGDGAVGKTSLIRKFTESSFKEDYIKTIGAQFSDYDKKINDDSVKLLFWDIAGQNDLNFLRPSFFNNSKAAIIVFSLEENDLGKASFEHVLNWHDDVKMYCGDISIFLFANKVDLIDENKLDKDRIKNLVEEHQFLNYCITSAKTGEGVIEAFNEIIDTLYDKTLIPPE
ncbi:MAG: GTP-binding protein, partial [Candidatus Lokiarchaeota archaeon]|nr:GTP-binding protein [Candidatus Lokiarchaeota archaeon]